VLLQVIPRESTQGRRRKFHHRF